MQDFVFIVMKIRIRSRLFFVDLGFNSLSQMKEF